MTAFPRRSAGAAHAIAAAIVTIAPTCKKVAASVEASSNSIADNSRVAPAATAVPATRPITTKPMPWPITSRTMLERLAPSATRMPISRARWLAEYMTTA